MRFFNSIKTTINYLDDKLSFFLLCETIYISTVLMFTVSAKLHSNTFMDCPYCFRSIWSLGVLVNNGVLFIVISVSACMVSEAYSDLWTQVKTLIVNLETDSSRRELKFLLCAEKEIHFTVWKIVPINRSFIMCTFGAIFTYVMLFDNLIFSRV